MKQTEQECWRKLSMAKATAAVRALAAVGVFALAMGCTVDIDVKDSEEVANMNMRADFFVTSTGADGIEVVARLRDTVSGIDVQLSGDDRLLAANGTTTEQALNPSGALFQELAEISDNVVELKKRNRLDWSLVYVIQASEPEYFAVFPNPNRSKPVYVALQRTFDNSVHDVEVTLPAPFSITEPDAGSRIPWDEPIVIRWSDAGSDFVMALHAAAECATETTALERYRTAIPLEGDPGEVEMSAAELFERPSPAGNCTLGLALERTRTDLAPAVFAAGSQVRGIERRSVTFFTTSTQP